MIENAKAIGNDRVIKFITQVDANLPKEYSSSLRFVSKPFEFKVINLQKFKYDQLISKLEETAIYTEYIK